MKRFGKRSAVFLLFFTLITGMLVGPWQPAAQAASSYHARVTVSTAKVHTSPSGRAHTVAKLHRNATVKVIGTRGSWKKISYGGKTRYIYAKYIKKSTPSYSFRSYTNYVKSYSLVMRSKASSHYRKIRSLYMNYKVTVIGAKGSYRYVRYGSRKGYVQAKWLKSTVKSYGAYVVPGSINLWKGPGKKYGRVGYLHQNNKITWTGSSHGYLKVNYNGTKGYAWGGYFKNGTPPKAAAAPAPVKAAAPAPVKTSAPAPAPTQVQPVISQNNNNLTSSKDSFIQYPAYVSSDPDASDDVYSEPNTTDPNKKKTTLSVGASVTVTGITGYYSKITYGSTKEVGYISSKALLKGNGPQIQGTASNPTQPSTSTTSKMGIDISHWQSQDTKAANSEINFQNVKNSGYQFVTMKATDGYPHEYDPSDTWDHIDPAFYSNMNSASNVSGLSTYAYHFFEADSVDNAIKEADYFTSVLTKANFSTNKYIFVDVENPPAGYTNHLSTDSATLTSQLNAFFSELNKNGYKKFGLYTNYNFYYERLNGQDLPNNMLLWIARYRYDTNEGWSKSPYNSTYKGPEIAADIWQYRTDGSVDGINNRPVDIDISYFADPNAF